MIVVQAGPVEMIIVVLFALLRPRLSVNAPGKLQHTFELVYEFLQGQADEQIGHGGRHYITFFGTLSIFILLANLIGIVPGFESPTMVAAVPLGRLFSITTWWAFRLTAWANTSPISPAPCPCRRR